MKKLSLTRTLKTDLIFYSFIIFISFFINISFAITNISEKLANIDSLIFLDSISISMWSMWISTSYSVYALYKNIKIKQVYSNKWVEFLTVSMLLASMILFIFYLSVGFVNAIINWTYWLKIINSHFLLPIAFLSYLLLFKNKTLVDNKVMFRSTWRLALISFVYIVYVLVKTFARLQLVKNNQFSFVDIDIEKLGVTNFIFLGIFIFAVHFSSYFAVIKINNLVNKNGGIYEKSW
ncbi:hypothetical protein NX779_00695 [Mycoplasma cottewii]|uniref:Transmembrane protein n=1 Tax=Mycoplasma cottewii TaxID=51364 RepID=A0ABY5TWW6_9MOLU|nr:hypothetical protein [Mycoplasma cottewii]UWD35164.1 hypothetical protein NX779_00695 [Mycoplasma cottewii]